jgi:putative MFS transporter
MSGKLSIDDAPFSAFHRRLAVYSCGGPFCDGYVLGIIAIALGPLSVDLGLSPLWQGIIAAASLAGMFVGGALFGYVTDLVGRQVMYTVDLLLLVLASVAQFWAHGPWALLVARLVLGVAVGADYPIAAALLAEFAPRSRRGMLLACMIAAWWGGYAVSFISGYALSGAGPTSWRWMLASSAIPAAVVALLRFGAPESPRWLVSKGRVAEARQLIQRHLGAEYDIEHTTPQPTRFSTIFGPKYLPRISFVCVFWSCQVIPEFAIDTFAPDLLRAFGSPDSVLGSALLSLFFLAGVVAAVMLIERIGRRPLLIVPFWVTGAALVILGVVPKTAVTVIVLCFIVFALFNAGSSVLQWVYPSELFPTQVRGTALGFATSVSRVGAAIGTFLFPIGMARLGASNLMLLVGAVCAVGGIVSVFYAPETRGLSLDESSGGIVPSLGSSVGAAGESQRKLMRRASHTGEEIE